VRSKLLYRKIWGKAYEKEQKLKIIRNINFEIDVKYSRYNLNPPA